jgi:SAM-dependent methyltransferase
MPILFGYEEQFQEEFKNSIQDYLDFVRDIGYRVERTVRSINYLIVPDGRLSVSVPPTPSSGSNGSNGLSVEHAAPAVLPNRKLCEFLRARSDVEEATRFLQHNGFASHVLVCKDWDLARIVPEIGDGNFLDMGSSESYVLKNVMLKRTRGEKYGIDLRAPDVPLRGVRYLIGDLMNVPVADGFFHYVTCLSVIEHEVDFRRFAQEASRLLVAGGKLFVTFDYWNPEVRPGIRLYGLAWQPLDEASVRRLLAECAEMNLHPVDAIDWTLGDPVLREGYFAPPAAKGIAYTFGLLTLEKREKAP